MRAVGKQSYVCPECGVTFQKYASQVITAEPYCSHSCANKRSIRTRRARGEVMGGRTAGPIKHGTRGAYVNRGCRCDDCQRVYGEYQRKYMREYRERRKQALQARATAGEARKE